MAIEIYRNSGLTHEKIMVMFYSYVNVYQRVLSMIRNYLYNMYMNHLMIMVPSFDPHIPPPISGVPGQRIMIHGIIQQVMYSIVQQL